MSSIAVMRGGAIGDFVSTLPAIDALRQAFPRARLSLIGNPAILCLVSRDRILDHNSASLAPLYTHTGPLPSTTRQLFENIDLLLAYAVDPEGILKDRLSSVVKGELIIHDPRPDPHYSCHITQHLLEPLNQRGIPVPDPLPHIQLRETDRTYAARCHQRFQLASPLIVIHPGSGGRHKCWPLTRFLKLIEQLQQQEIHTVLLYGPAEEAFVRDLQDRISSSCTILTPPGLLELASILEDADLFVGNDSGPGHMAAALGTPTLTVFGPTDPRVWRPCGPHARIIQAPAGKLKALDVDSVRQDTLEHLERFRSGDG